MNSKPKSPTPATARQTGDKVSQLAGRVQRALRGENGSLRLTGVSVTAWTFICDMRVSELKALAASCLAQDETKGLRTPKPRKAKRAKGRKS